jgi:hypothetical protein
MREHNVSVFALENRQKIWLASRQQIILHEWIVAVLGGVMASFLFSLVILVCPAPSLFKVLFVLGLYWFFPWAIGLKSRTSQ